MVKKSVGVYVSVYIKDLMDFSVFYLYNPESAILTVNHCISIDSVPQFLFLALLHFHLISESNESAFTSVMLCRCHQWELYLETFPV